MTRGMAMLLTLLVLTSALFAGWYSGRRADYFPDRLGATFPQCAGLPYELADWPILHEGDDDQFSVALADFHEPSLYERPTSALPSVRLLLIPDFYDLVLVRVDTLADGRFQLTAKRRPGGGGFYHPWGTQHPHEHDRILRPEEAERFQAVIDAAGLPDLPDSGCQPALHGETWIIEASDGRGHYRYRQVQSPTRGVERDIGMMLLNLTGWEVEPIIRHRPA